VTRQVGSDVGACPFPGAKPQKIPPLLSWRGRVIQQGRADGGTSADKTACADVYVPARSRAMQLGLLPLEASATGGLDLGRDVI